MLEVVEIIRKMDQGLTQPYLCKADNGETYVVKGAGALGKGRISELVVGNLGRTLNLPIPEFDIIDVPEYLIGQNTDLFMDVGVGPAFASKYIPMAQEVNHTTIRSAPSELLKNIFIFDYWVQNEDRKFTTYGGNPNLLYNLANQKLIVFDHNNAFDRAFNVNDFCSEHVGRNAWFKTQMDLLRNNEFKSKMSSALTNLENILDTIPEEWLVCSSVEENFRENIHSCLNRYEEDTFWEALQ